MSYSLLLHGLFSNVLSVLIISFFTPSLLTLIFLVSPLLSSFSHLILSPLSSSLCPPFFFSFLFSISVPPNIASPLSSSLSLLSFHLILSNLISSISIPFIQSELTSLPSSLLSPSIVLSPFLL